MSVSRHLDRFQRRHRWAGLPLAVLYKFVDDQGNYLAALLTYYGFLSMFPLLLLAATVLGFTLHGTPTCSSRSSTRRCRSSRSSASRSRAASAAIPDRRRR